MIDINKLKVDDEINDFLVSYCLSNYSIYGTDAVDSPSFGNIILYSHTVSYINKDYIILSSLYYYNGILLLLNPR